MQNYLVALLILVLCQSCVKPLLKKHGVIDGKVNIKKIAYPNKEVLFMSMVHLAEPKFYESCQIKIDSLLKEGYFIFGEGISGEALKGEKPTSQDTLNDKKVRKLLGINPFNLPNHPIIAKWINNMSAKDRIWKNKKMAFI
jgi:hypothetical protein